MIELGAFFTASELASAGYSVSELLNALFSEQELLSAGCDPEELASYFNKPQVFNFGSDDAPAILVQQRRYHPYYR